MNSILSISSVGAIKKIDDIEYLTFDVNFSKPVKISSVLIEMGIGTPPVPNDGSKETITTSSSASSLTSISDDSSSSKSMSNDSSSSLEKLLSTSTSNSSS